MPLKPESYRITAYFPEATQLATESDVRIGGVSVGKVKSVELAPVDEQVDGQDTSEVEIEIDPEFAPISSDARAILRQKTLLGETYVELTSGTEPGKSRRAGLARRRREHHRREAATSSRSPRAARSASARSRTQTQIDEIFNALDEETRTAFQQLAAERRDRDQGPRPRPERRVRQPRPVPRRRLGRPRRPAPPAGRRCRASFATPAPSSTRSASATGSSPARSPGPTRPSTRSPPRTRRCATSSRSSRRSRTRRR